MKKSLIIPNLFKNLKNITSFQTTRNSKIDLKNIDFTKIGIDNKNIVLSNQIHSDKILDAKKGGIYEGYDAFITDKKNLFVIVKSADCLTILITNKSQNIIAAVHAGWKGSALKITEKVINKIHKEYKINPNEILVWFGACISVKYYEVGNEVSNNFEEDEKIYFPDKQKFHIDLVKSNYNQLINNGVLRENIELSNLCTIEKNDIFYSYRHNKEVKERMISLIGIRK